eukprot:2340701-Lingulodinium_polyedra.AAC.1
MGLAPPGPLWAALPKTQPKNKNNTETETQKGLRTTCRSASPRVEPQISPPPRFVCVCAAVCIDAGAVL